MTLLFLGWLECGAYSDVKWGNVSVGNDRVTRPSEGHLDSYLCFYYGDPSVPGWWVDFLEPGFHAFPRPSQDLVKGSMPRIGDQLREETQWAGIRNGK